MEKKECKKENVESKTTMVMAHKREQQANQVRRDQAGKEKEHSAVLKNREKEIMMGSSKRQFFTQTLLAGA